MKFERAVLCGIRNSAMKYCKSVAIPAHWADSLGPRTFVRAAYFAQVLTVAAVGFALLVLAVTSWSHAALAVVLCLFLCFILTPAIWMIAAVLGAIVLLPRWLWTNGRNRGLRTRFAKFAHSSVWDDWLDGPS
jgi:hypothetical protein